MKMNTALDLFNRRIELKQVLTELNIEQFMNEPSLAVLLLSQFGKTIGVVAK